MRRRRRAARGESIFEMLSDISLSALGLFLIVFVIYAVLFNSVASPQEVARLREQNEDLSEENAQLRSETSELEEQADAAEERAEEAEQELARIQQRSELTGYYVGDRTGKLYPGGSNCTGEFREIEGEHSVLYIGSTNTIVYSMVYPDVGELTYRFQGELNGRTFNSVDTNYTRTRTLEACGNPSENTIRVEFNEGGIELFVTDAATGNEERYVLREVS